MSRCVCDCVCFVSMISCICTYHGKLICLTQTTVPEDRFFNGFTALSARGFTVPRATSSTLFVGSSQTFCGARSVRRLCSLWEALSWDGSSLIVGVSSDSRVFLASEAVKWHFTAVKLERKGTGNHWLSDIRVAHFRLRHDSCFNAKLTLTRVKGRRSVRVNQHSDR